MVDLLVPVLLPMELEHRFDNLRFGQKVAFLYLKEGSDADLPFVAVETLAGLVNFVAVGDVVVHFDVDWDVPVGLVLLV